MLFFRKKIILCLLALTLFSACSEKNPVSSKQDDTTILKPDSLYTVIIYFEDHYGNPVSGARIRIKEYTGSQLTDEQGIAVFDSLPPGNYKVMSEYSKREETNIIIFENDITLKDNKIIETKFKVPSTLTLNFRYQILHQITEQLYPLVGAEIRTEPETITVITDENGCAVIENIPMKQYTVIVTKNKIRKYKMVELTIKNGQLEEIIRTYLDDSPSVKIISPNDSLYHNIYNIHFIGYGNDFFDGELLFDAFTWYSDIDGELGTGREIMVDRLNIGHHTITLIGTDSVQNEDKYSIDIFISFFDNDTYYPIPYSGNWYYLYTITDFSVTTVQGEIEYWSLKDLKVSTNDINTRNSLMEYTITKEDSSKRCRYYVVDYYETDSNNIYVSKTTEQLIIYDDNTEIDEPIEQIDIETVYSPLYLLIKNHMDLSLLNLYETNVTASVTFSYYNSILGTYTVTKDVDVNTVYDISESEIVETKLGTYDTVPITITTGEAVRKWWLAKGIGIVKLEFNTFEFPLTATLYDTNIFSFSESGHAQKFAVLPIKSDHRHKKIKSPSNTPERMLELCRFLRELCPQ